MNIVHAVWEKRNLGVDCYKMTVTDEDTWETVVNEEKEVHGDYLVIKVPERRRDISIRLNELGYSFVEAQYHCYYDNSKKFELSPIQKRLYDNMTYSEMNNDDIRYMNSRISEGLFVDCTEAVDPAFSVQLADKRVVGHISDELEKGGRIYKMTYRDKPVGFFGLAEQDDGNCRAYIGGIYPEFQRAGFGPLMYYSYITESIRLGAKKTISGFSTNNHGANAMHMALGYILDHVEYIFVKHDKRREHDE